MSTTSVSTSSVELCSKPAIRHAEKPRTSTCRFADKIACISIEQYRRLISSKSDQNSHACLATIVACYQEKLYVLALGAGTKFNQHRQDLERISDCHAEVLCRRAFRRYLTLDIMRKHQNAFSIVEQHPSNKRFRLRPGVTLHFYCSTAPCGNATLKKHVKLQRERFRDSIPDWQWPLECHESMLPGHSLPLGQFALLLKKINNNNTNQELQQQPTKNDSSPWRRLSRKEQQWPCHTSDAWCPPGTTTVWTSHGSHTCSDKLCRWNCLGLQGSLLMQFLDEPLYCSTLTVGRKFAEATCRRAVCCRVGRDGDVVMRNTRFRVNHPSILGTSVALDESIVETGNEMGQDVRFHSPCVWAWWPDQLEGIDGSTGLLYQDTDAGEGGRSLLSTAALTDLFLELTMESQKTRPLNPTTLLELGALKRAVSREYEEVKDDLLTTHPVLKTWRRRYES